MDFRGIQALVELDQQRGQGFEPGTLPEQEREALCRNLLAEFGVTKINARDGELIHGCVLPFGQHKDQSRHPTGSLNYKKLVYKCVGSCDAGGGLLWFIGLCRGSSGTEARKWLNSQTGTGGEEQTLASLLAYFDMVYSKERQVLEPIPHMSAGVLTPWMMIHPYLTEMRGIAEANVVRFSVGWNPDTNRIVIPHFWKGRLVGWQTRRLVDDGSPKYVSSPDFPKDQTIYNYRPGEHAVLVEAPITVVSKENVGHFEATFGATVTDRQVKLLSMHESITLFFDNDPAGWKATERLANGLASYSVVNVVDNPWNADAGDLSEGEVVRLVDSAVPYSLWTPPKDVQQWVA